MTGEKRNCRKCRHYASHLKVCRNWKYKCTYDPIEDVLQEEVIMVTEEHTKTKENTNV